MTPYTYLCVYIYVIYLFLKLTLQSDGLTPHTSILKSIVAINKDHRVVLSEKTDWEQSFALQSMLGGNCFVSTHDAAVLSNMGPGWKHHQFPMNIIGSDLFQPAGSWPNTLVALTRNQGSSNLPPC